MQNDSKEIRNKTAFSCLYLYNLEFQFSFNNDRKCKMQKFKRALFYFEKLFVRVYYLVAISTHIGLRAEIIVCTTLT